MPRIRTIKPEFPHSESMGKVGREARLCFILLWTLADDQGRLRGQSKMLASLLFPYDADAAKHMDGWLAELEREGCLLRYVVDSNHYLAILNWSKHQKIDRPSATKFPDPPHDSRGLARIREDSRGLANVREGSTKAREDSSEDRRIGGSGSEDQGSIAPQAEPPASRRTVQADRPEDVTPATWEGFLAIRKARRAPLTVGALDGIRAEAAKANVTLEAALLEAASRGWQSFRSDWVQPQPGGGGKAPLKFAKAVSHMPNMPLGTAACACSECVAYRNKRGVM